MKPDDAGHLLSELLKVLPAVEDFSAANLERFLKEEFCVNMGIQIGKIIHALRVATTGKAAGFGTFETLSVLGQERCINRIRLALEKLAEHEKRNAV